jgi:hypothetical protein
MATSKNLLVDNLRGVLHLQGTKSMVFTNGDVGSIDIVCTEDLEILYVGSETVLLQVERVNFGYYASFIYEPRSYPILHTRALS